MNKLILKNEEMLSSYFDCEDASQVVNRIKQQMEEQKQVICSIRVNEKDIPEALENTLIDFKLSGVRMIEVEHCDYNDFYTEFMTSTTKFVTDLKQLCPHISDSIYENNMVQFNKLFQDFIESMDSLMTAIHFIHYKGSALATESNWREIENRTSEVLKQILQLYPAKDFVSLADVFDYDMLDVLDDWLALLQTKGADEQRRERQNQNN